MHNSSGRASEVKRAEVTPASDARRRALAGQGVFQHDAMLAQIGQALSARKNRDVVSGRLQPRCEETAKRACSVDYDSHGDAFTLVSAAWAAA